MIEFEFFIFMILYCILLCYLYCLVIFDVRRYTIVAKAQRVLFEQFVVLKIVVVDVNDN